MDVQGETLVIGFQGPKPTQRYDPCQTHESETVCLSALTQPLHPNMLDFAN